MIDLSNARVGDLYECDSGFAHKVVIVGDIDVVTIAEYPKAEYPEGNLHCVFRKSNAEEVEDGSAVLVSKIDNRPWLKDMPDARIFDDKVKWLEYSGGHECWLYSWNDSYEDLRRIPLKMPEITQKQAKDSKITIKELREWQLNNK